MLAYPSPSLPAQIIKTRIKQTLLTLTLAFIDPSKKPLPKRPCKPLHSCGVFLYDGGIKKTLVFLNLLSPISYAEASQTPRCNLCSCVNA